MAVPIEKTNVVTAIVYDVETGGLDCNKCAVTQVSFHAVRLDTFELMETYVAYIYPYTKKKDIGKPKRKVLKNKYDTEEEELMEYGSGAEAITHITMDLLYAQGKQLEIVCEEICDFIERNTLPVPASNKPIMVGQNPLFDNGFIQQIMLYTGLWARFCKLVRGKKDYWGNFQPVQVDTIILAQLALGDDKSINNWKLESLADIFGIELDDAHDADADVGATRDILKVIASRMRNSSNYIGEEFTGIKKEKLRDYFKI